MKMTRRHAVVGVAALSLGGGAAMLALADWRTLPSVPVATTNAPVPGGPFSLVNHSGQTVTDRDYRGKFMLVFFGYTMCPDVCPTTLMDISNVMQALGESANRVQPLFISVDPERDTPSVLKDYLSSFDARIVGLTGTPADVQRVASAYRVFYSKFATGGDSYTVDHSAYIYVMGPDGGYRTHFAHTSTPTAIAKNVRDLVNGRSSGMQ